MSCRSERKPAERGKANHEQSDSHACRNRYTATSAVVVREALASSETLSTALARRGILSLDETMALAREASGVVGAATP
jgi:hypothetical protein